jgi:hypothetical protein
MSKTFLYPGFDDPNNNKGGILGGKKTCPKCLGSGTNGPIIMIKVNLFPDEDDNKNKKPNKLFMCEYCNGTGTVPRIRPIICSK